MSDIKISNLPETLNIDESSVFPLVFQGVTSKITFKTLKNVLQYFTSISYNKTTGKFTFTRTDGQTAILETDLQNSIKNVQLLNNNLIFTKNDDKTITINVENIIIKQDMLESVLSTKIDNSIKDVSITNNTLTFTKNDNTKKIIDLPEPEITPPIQQNSDIIIENNLESDSNCLSLTNTKNNLKIRLNNIASNRLYQDIRTKNNLFNINDKKTNGGFGTGVTIDEDDWVTITCDNSEGTTPVYQNVFTNPSTKIKPNTKYYFVLEIKTATGTGTLNILENYVGVSESQFTTNKKEYLLSEVSGGGIYKFSTTSKEDLNDNHIISMCKSFGLFAAGRSGSITFRISIYEDEEYSTNFSYEPYGIAPSFEISSTVEGVTGDLTISNYNENLYNVKDIYGKGTNVVIDEDDWISVSYDNSQGTAIHFENFFTRFNNLVQTNKKYYLVMEVAEANGWGFIDLCSKVNDNDKSQFNKLTAIQINSLHAGDIIIKELNSLDKFKGNEKYLRSYFQFDKKNVGSCKIRLSILEQEPKQETFVYQKHQSDSYTISLGDKVLYGNELARDKIIRKDGKWYFEKKWETATLNGGNNDGVWFQESTGTGFRYYCNNQSRKCMSSKNNIINVFSDKLCGLAAIDTWNGKEGISGTVHNIQIRLKDFNENKTLSEFKQFLSENPITVIYKLETPIEEEITEENLLVQLNKLLNIKQYNDVTNIIANQNVLFNLKYETGKNRASIDNIEIYQLSENLRQSLEIINNPDTLVTKEYVDNAVENYGIFYWDGQSSTNNPNNIELWQKIVDKSKEQTVLVYTSLETGNNDRYNAMFFVNAGKITSTVKSISLKGLVSQSVINTLASTGVSIIIYYPIVNLTLNENIVLTVSKLNFSSTTSPTYLPTNNQQITSFEPSYDYHPATKKYVDDSISNIGENNIINTLRAVGSCTSYAYIDYSNTNIINKEEVNANQWNWILNRHKLGYDVTIIERNFKANSCKGKTVIYNFPFDLTKNSNNQYIIYSNFVSSIYNTESSLDNSQVNIMYNCKITLTVNVDEDGTETYKSVNWQENQVSYLKYLSPDIMDQSKYFSATYASQPVSKGYLDDRLENLDIPTPACETKELLWKGVSMIDFNTGTADLNKSESSYDYIDIEFLSMDSYTYGNNVFIQRFLSTKFNSDGERFATFTCLNRDQGTYNSFTPGGLAIISKQLEFKGGTIKFYKDYVYETETKTFKESNYLYPFKIWGIKNP